MTQLTKVTQNIHKHKDKSCNPKNIKTNSQPKIARSIPIIDNLGRFLLGRGMPVAQVWGWKTVKALEIRKCIKDNNSVIIILLAVQVIKNHAFTCENENINSLVGHPLLVGGLGPCAPSPKIFGAVQNLIQLFNIGTQHTKSSRVLTPPIKSLSTKQSGLILQPQGGYNKVSFTTDCDKMQAIDSNRHV